MSILPRVSFQKPPPGSVLDASHPLAAGLVGAWLFNEGTGTVARDLVQFQEGQLRNGPTWGGVPGRDAGLAFSHSGDTFVLVRANDDTVFVGVDPPAIFALLKDITVVTSYRLKSLPADNTGHAFQLVAKDKDTGGRSFTLDVLQETDTLSAAGLRFYINGGGATDQVTEARQPVIGDDRQAVGTFQAQDKLLKLYINGRLNASGASTLSAIPASTSDLMFGRRNYSGYEDALDGWMRYVYIWSRCLSPQEILQLYEEPYCFVRGPEIARRFAAVSIPDPKKATPTTAALVLTTFPPVPVTSNPVAIPTTAVLTLTTYPPTILEFAVDNYPAPSSRRWAYDAEGFTVYRYTDLDVSGTALSSGDINKLNNENDDAVTLNPSGGTLGPAIISKITGVTRVFLPLWSVPADLPAWDNAVAYIVGDGVVVSGTPYVCVVGHSGHTPPNASFWAQSVSTYLSFLPAEVRKLQYAALIFNPMQDLQVQLQSSDDTTNGFDGTWATLSAGGSPPHPVDVAEGFGLVRPAYRSALSALTGIVATHKGYRFRMAGTPGSTGQGAIGCRIAHLFGPEAGPTDRLAFWDAFSDHEFTADLDLGDVPRGGTTQLPFRIKNVSPTKTATSISLTTSEVDSDGVSAAYTLLSLDNITFAQSIAPANLAPGVISPTYWARSSPDTSQRLNVEVCRIHGAAVFV
jgi:hypothetical protein